MFIDTHCHLDDNAFERDLPEIIQRAENYRVGKIISIAESVESCYRTLKLAENFPEVYAVIGVHPHNADSFNELAKSRLKNFLNHHKVVGIGETGLDYYYDYSERKNQRNAFINHLNIASENNLPVVIHCRDAYNDLIAILKEQNLSQIKGVVHCFSGNSANAKILIEMGFYISVTGAITFKNANKLREVIKGISIDKLMLETDAPYLAPEPYRGKRNEPSYIIQIAKTLAEVKSLSIDDVERITTLNASKLFNIPIEIESRIAYKIRNSLYLNITNRCSNACDFCPRGKDYVVKGHYLYLEKEPTVEEIITAIGDPKYYDEVVFCGYGEPTIRLDAMKEVAKWLKKKGVKVRLNTNGHGNVINKRNILPELEGLIDVISVSLNSDNKEQYYALCNPTIEGDAFEAVKEFIRESVKHIPMVIVTIVAKPEVDLKKCEELAYSLGAKFRVREYMEVG